MRILLVEDDQQLGDSVHRALCAEGYAVDWLDDGRLAIPAVTAESFDLVVLDLRLPGKSGVITSYSIHYTKLYDRWQLPGQGPVRLLPPVVGRQPDPARGGAGGLERRRCRRLSAGRGEWQCRGPRPHARGGVELHKSVVGGGPAGNGRNNFV